MNGANGHTLPAVPEPAIELLEQLASYKTALLALLQMVKRGHNEWRSAQDQMLIREIERLIERGEAPPDDEEKK